MEIGTEVDLWRMRLPVHVRREIGLSVMEGERWQIVSQDLQILAEFYSGELATAYVVWLNQAETPHKGIQNMDANKHNMAEHLGIGKDEVVFKPIHLWTAICSFALGIITGLGGAAVMFYWKLTQ